MMIPREIIIVLGKTGYGKSRWTWQYIAGKPRVFCYDPLHDAPNMEWRDAPGLVDAYDEQQFHGEGFRYATADFGALDCIGHMAYLVGNCVLVVEEASLIYRKGQPISGWSQNIVFLGRHRNVSLLVTAQRAASIPIEMRSQASRIVTFAQTEGDDIGWLRGAFGSQIDNVATLQRGQCLDSDAGEIRCYSIF